MSNYTPTTTAGTTRRRAKSITINNPAHPLIAPEPVLTYDPDNPDSPPVMKTPEMPVASVTFVMEDRIILSDDSEIFVPAGNLIIKLDADTLAKSYPSVDVETGIVNDTEARYGTQIVQMIVGALEDVFVIEAMAFDATK